MRLKLIYKQVLKALAADHKQEKLKFIEDRVKTWVSEVIEGQDGLAVQANLITRRVDNLVQALRVDSGMKDGQTFLPFTGWQGKRVFRNTFRKLWYLRPDLQKSTGYCLHGALSSLYAPRAGKNWARGDG